MAKLMMRQRMPEIKEIERKKQHREEYQTGSADASLRLLGCKKITLKDLEMDVFQSSKFN